jgi:DNA modification methylase
LERYAYDAGLYLYDKRVWVKDPSWANSRWTSTSLKAVSEYEDIYVFWKPGQQVIDRHKLTNSEWKEWGSRGVWYVDSVRRNDDHEAKFPLELAQRVVLLFSDKGDVVLDPFMGSGTTAIAALSTGRKFIGIEKEEKYVDLANAKVEQFELQASLLP